MDGPRIRALLDGLDDDTVHPYSKWHGAHWRLVELVELEATDDERVPAAVLRQKRLKNGRWRGSEMITLNALRVLQTCPRTTASSAASPK